MEKNEIKKALYRHKPEAKLMYIRKGNAHYVAHIPSHETEDFEVRFSVPVSDMGDADFLPSMQSNLLNRWID